jgi:2-amino-4-hydroxy-6-hydroxymethyldihydropteridine diphosphokinase
MNRFVISLGSNIDKEKNLPEALRLLRQRCQVVAVSSVYETKPVGLEGQPVFWNAAAIVNTEKNPIEFKRDILTWVEQRLERKRTADQNAPRTIDIDITLFNNEVFDLDETHHIPDPDLLRYPHVSVPIAELLPVVIHPETGETLQELSSRLAKNELLEGNPAPQRRAEVQLQ